MNERIEHPRDYEAESRRHRILWIGGAVVAVLAIIVYFVATRDDGEENRAAYCSALSDMVGSDSLEQALKGANKAEVERITELAPRRRRACLGQPVRRRRWTTTRQRRSRRWTRPSCRLCSTRSPKTLPRTAT